MASPEFIRPSVERATHEDLGALCTLLSDLFAQEVEFGPDANAQATGLRAILDDPHEGVVLVARHAGQAVGMAVLLFTISTALGGRVALLEDVVVRRDLRSRGIGAPLIEEAIRTARAEGCLRVTLLTDLDNTAAQRFYDRAGFQASAMIPMRMIL